MNHTIVCTLESFLNYQPLSQLMQGAGAAVLTILVTFAIGIFVHHLSDGERKGSSLDLHVALDYVWFFVPSLVVVGLMVTTPFFMGMGGLEFKSTVFTVWLATFLWLFWILLRLYRWVKGDKDDFRLRYLSDFRKSSRDGIASWRDWWATKRTSGDRFVEKDFFVAFSKQIDSILGTEDKAQWETLPKLLEGFLSNIDNRNKTFLLVFEEGFPKILEWHYVLWRRQYSRFAKEHTGGIDTMEAKVFETDRIVDEIIKFITKEALGSRSGNSFSYFKHLDSHIQKYETVFIEGSQHTYTYVENLPIYNDCLELIPESPESYSIWEHYFPPRWKVTLENFRQHVISRVWFNHFIQWAQSRIWSDTNEWDKALEEVSRDLFPTTEPNTWSKILTFILRPWSGESRIQAVIEKGPTFGHIGRMVTGWGEEDISTMLRNQERSQEHETIKLAILLFRGFFTKDNLDKWLGELERLEYQEGSKQDHSKREWRRILTLLKSEIKGA